MCLKGKILLYSGFYFLPLFVFGDVHCMYTCMHICLYMYIRIHVHVLYRAGGREAAYFTKQDVEQAKSGPDSTSTTTLESACTVS